MTRPALPGFYYDEEKNRYFPIKGPHPGSKSSSSRTAQKPDKKPAQKINLKAAKLLSSRELNGNSIAIDKKKSSFEEEFQKLQASWPKVWRYEHTSKIADVAIKHVQIDVQTYQGPITRDFLLTGSMTGSLSLLDIKDALEQSDFGNTCEPYRVGPPCQRSNIEDRKLPLQLSKPFEILNQSSSSILSITPFLLNYEALISFAASDSSASTSIMNLDNAVNSGSSYIFSGERAIRRASLHCTVWTADCHLKTSRVALGSDRGGILIDWETRVESCFLHTKSDVLALKFHHSGNLIHCGLRNGAIVAVDVRDRPDRVSSRLTRHQIPYQPSKQTNQSSKRKWFEVKGNLNSSQIIYMPSSITCLALLETCDHYLMASSMDGSMKLYDHRMMKGEAVQSYEGHVNSHTRIQFGIDPSERFVMSGGSDGYVRIWSIKSGQLLSENQISDSALSALAWPTSHDLRRCGDEGVGGAWLASEESIYYIRYV